ncbi:LOW QUALITY PROTEIN: cholecystokinin receptor type A-like [Scylla paramamosain]|uniref:LOW QUALITY PROTEIN: cholecystokinin receptor type A-like n=1 Tax=Scylla paramamosain TaxID=85552 RepID=UPI003083755F
MEGGETKLRESVEEKSESQHKSQSDTSFHALHVSPFIPDPALNDDDSPAKPSLDRTSASVVGKKLVPTASGDKPSSDDDTWTPASQSFRSQGSSEQADDEDKSNMGLGREAGELSRMANRVKIETRGMDESLPVRPSQEEERSDNVLDIQNEAALQFYEAQTNTASDKQQILIQEHGELPLLSPSDETRAGRGRKVLQGPTSKRGTNQAHDIPLLDTEGSVRIPCYVIIFLLGMIGNTLVIVTLLQNRKMRTITNVFLLNLAFSDLLLGVFCMPFTLIGSLLRDFIFGAVMCRLIPYFQAVSVSVSVWTLVAISLERFYAICQPLKSRGWQTLSHAYKIISLVWLLSLVFMAPIAVLSQLLPVGNTSRHKCREMWPSLHFERGFSMFLCATLLLVPLVIMVAAYSSITISLWHGMKLERETGQGTEPLISLTDLNGLAMVQQSLRRKQSRRHVSKISIRFRKIPAQTKQCVHCGRLKGKAISPIRPRPGEGHPHACLHDPDCENYKWRVESVRESNNGGRRRVDGMNNALGISTSSPCSRRPTKPDFKRLRSTHLEKSIEAKKHVIRMLFVVVLEFFLCWTPIFVVNIMCLYIPEQVYRTLGSVGISFLHLLSYASSCCNPITYCFMNKKFLPGFRYAFGCRKEAERNGRKNGTAASFRSQSNNIFKLATEVKRDARETTV